MSGSADGHYGDITADLAATLIAGAHSLTPAALRVLSKMQHAYAVAFRYYIEVSEKDEAGKWTRQRSELPATALRSHDMERCEQLIATERRQPGATFDAWLAGPQTAFEKQTFRQDDLARWTNACGIRSAYDFEAENEVATEHISPADNPTGPHAAAKTWTLHTPERFKRYIPALYAHLELLRSANQPIPTARDVLEAWRINPPDILIGRPSDTSFRYRDESTGKIDDVSLRNLARAIKRLTEPPKRRVARGEAA